MATITLLRATGAARAMRLAGPMVMRQGLPATTTLVPKNTLMLSPAVKTRGPVEPGSPSDTGHWSKERYLSALLLPVFPLAVALPNPVLDYTVAAAMVLHSQWGMEQILIDYVKGPAFKIAKGSVLALSIIAFAGLINLNYNDVGFGTAMQQLFTAL